MFYGPCQAELSVGCWRPFLRVCKPALQRSRPKRAALAPHSLSLWGVFPIRLFLTLNVMQTAHPTLGLGCLVRILTTLSIERRQESYLLTLASCELTIRMHTGTLRTQQPWLTMLLPYQAGQGDKTKISGTFSFVLSPGRFPLPMAAGFVMACSSVCGLQA